MTDVEASWEVPHPDQLTMAELDEVLEMTGIDIQNAGAGSSGRVLAALVTWHRKRNGEPSVTFDEVYATLRGRQVRLTGLDPTPPAPATG